MYVSPIFNLRIHQKMLTSTKFLLHFFIIFPFFPQNYVQVRYSNTGFPLFCFMFLSPTLMERVVTWELLFAKRTYTRLLQTWLSLLLGHMKSLHHQHKFAFILMMSSPTQFSNYGEVSRNQNLRNFQN